MPIIGLTTGREASFVEVARLRLGIPKEEAEKINPETKKPYGPMEIEYFRLDPRPDEPTAAQTFLSAYGPKPTRLNVRLAFPQIERCWDANYRVYNKSGMLGSADGKRWIYLRSQQGKLLVREGVVMDTSLPGVRTDPETGEPYMAFDRDMPVYSYTSKKGDDVAVYAKVEGRLKVLIPELKRACYMTMITHSIYNVMNLTEELLGIEYMAKQAGLNLSMVPMVLFRRLDLISTSINGRKSMQNKYLCHLEIDPRWMEAQFAMLNAVLPGYALPAPKQEISLQLPSYVSQRDIEANEDENGQEESGEAAATAPAAPVPEKPAAGPAPAAAAPATTQAATEASPTRPYSPSVVKEKLQTAAQRLGAFVPSEGQRNLLRHCLEVAFAGQPDIEDKRHTVLKFLTGSTSTKDVSGPMLKAILDVWLQAKPDSGGAYSVDKMAAREAQDIWQASLKAEGQMTMALALSDTDEPDDGYEPPEFGV